MGELAEKMVKHACEVEDDSFLIDLSADYIKLAGIVIDELLRRRIKNE